MKQKPTMSAEAQTLSRWRDDAVWLRVVLVNGVVLEGRLAGFDRYLLLLESSARLAVYKHVVQTIEATPGQTSARPPRPGEVTVRVRKRRVPAASARGSAAPPVRSR